MENMAFRQVHFDAHTSPKLPDVGKEFNAQEFVDTLKKASVNSITCFARCHHGMLYYDSKLFPELVHPNLKNKNLLKEQIKVCHENGIKVPVYITVQWDEYIANKHPEWIMWDEKGNFKGGDGLFTPGFYRNLCVNSPYRDFLKLQTQEVLEMFEDLDGLFFDICNARACYCNHCTSAMKALGYNPTNEEHATKYARILLDDFMQDMVSLIRKYNKNCGIFFNTSHLRGNPGEIVSQFTHFEVEALGSGAAGYFLFPVVASYLRTYNLKLFGMTGKFHTGWADFHSYKTKESLEFECFRSLAYNAGCIVGDQMHPNGKISKHTYELIGSVYEQVAQKEEWCVNAKAIVDIGVFITDKCEINQTISHLSPTMVGVVRMLLENGYQFDIIDESRDFSKYKVLILPDHININGVLKNKISEYIINGGHIICSYKSGLNEEETEFVLDELGIQLQGKAPYSPDFIVPTNIIGKDLYNTEYAMYLQGLQVSTNAGTQVLCNTKTPYFNRSWEHFTSHKHTPSSGLTGYAAITKNNNCIYFMHPIFTQFCKNAPKWCKQLFTDALNLLLPKPILKHYGPSTLLCTVNEQVDKNRWVVHLLHYIPIKKSIDIEIVEDVIPLFNINLSVNVKSKVKSVKSVPDGESLEFNVKDNELNFSVPKVDGHKMIEIKYC